MTDNEAALTISKYLNDIVENRLPKILEILVAHSDRLDALEEHPTKIHVKRLVTLVDNLRADLAVVASGYSALSDRISTLEKDREVRSGSGLILPS